MAPDTRRQAKGVDIYFGNLEPKTVLFVPPGFVVASSSASESACPAGLRESFLPTAATEWQSEQFTSILKMVEQEKDNSATAKMLHLYLDVLVVAAAARRK